MKQLRFLILVVFLVSGCMGIAPAFGALLADSDQRVYDYAGLFPAAKVAELNTKARALTLQHLQDVVVVTINNSQGKSAMDYADDFYDYNGFGIGPDYNGLLLLIDMDNREFYITTTGSAIKIFTDAKIDAMLDNIYKYVAKGDYAGGAGAFLRDTERYLEAINKPKQIRYWSWEFFGVGLFAIFMIMGTIILRHKRGLMSVPSARVYLDNASCDLTKCEDNFLRSSTRRIRIDSDSSSSGGSSTHTSSSGTTHGGGGRSF